MSRRIGWALARARAGWGARFGVGWAAGVAFARPESAVATPAGSSVPAAEGYGAIALRNTYDPGEGAAMHQHAQPRLVVVLSGGTLEVTGPDGVPRTVDLAVGQAMVRGPESHAIRNVGPTTVETIEMEFRGPLP